MFDPYHKWLGIPPKDQPPNHYRLLGLELGESDVDVIDAAANRQMAYVQQRATGTHVALSQKLLNELSAARVCLLDPKRKAAYDAELQAATKPLPAAADSAKPKQPSAIEWKNSFAKSNRRTMTTTTKRLWNSSKGNWQKETTHESTPC